MQAETVLRATLDAIAAGDAAGAARRFAPTARLELPLLGQLLIGRAQIVAGLERLCGASRTRRFHLARVHAGATAAIAEGRFEAEREGGEPEAWPLALVLEAGEEGISRLSMYLDTYGRRLWCEGLIPESTS